MKKLLIPPQYHRNLVPTSNNVYFQDLFVSSLFYDEIYFFNYLLNEKTNKIISSLKSEGIVNTVPFSFYRKSLNNLLRIFTSKIKLYQLENEHANYILSYENLHKKSYHRDLERMQSKYESEFQNNNYWVLLYIKKVDSIIDFVKNYRRSKRNLSNNLIKDFSLMNSFESFIKSIEALLSALEFNYSEGISDVFNFNEVFEVFNYSYNDIFLENFNFDVECQKNFKSLGGYNFKVDVLPPMKYFEDYFQFIEAYILFDTAIDYSLTENVVIKLPSSVERKSNCNSFIRENCKIYNDNYYAIYKCMIDNINFPVINTVEEYLKLRSNKHIKEFKKILELWNQAIQNDEYSALEDLKKYLIRANRKFSNLDKIKASSIEFFIAVPFAIIDLIFKTPTSILPLAISTYIKLDEVVTKYRYRGLMMK